MKKKIIKTLKKRLFNRKGIASRKDMMLGTLICNDFCIAYNEKQDIPIWNYMLSENKHNLFVYDEDDNTIYDGLIIDAPDYLFKYGDKFAVVHFDKLNIEENIASRKNFYLLQEFNPHLKGEI